jgi:hypothetical protein
MAQSPNRILDVLPQNIFAALRSHLSVVNLVFGDLIAEPGKPVARVYFHTPASFRWSSRWRSAT